MKTVESRSVVFPVFLECSKIVTDSFWQKLFLDLSESKCPKCIFISNNVIYNVNKRKPFSYKIPLTSENVDIPDLVKNFHDLLTVNTTICSNKDNEQKKKEMLARKRTNNDNKLSNCSWSSIRKKNEKEMHIINYVFRMKNEHNLDWDTTKDLLQNINIGILYKTQTSKDIIFNNNRIESINGITYNEKNNEFVNNCLQNEIKEVSSNDDSKLKISDYWKKYLLTMTSGSI